MCTVRLPMMALHSLQIRRLVFRKLQRIRFGYGRHERKHAGLVQQQGSPRHAILYERRPHGPPASGRGRRGSQNARELRHLSLLTSSGGLRR